MTLTKLQIIDAISEANGYSCKKAAEVGETVLEIIKPSLEFGNDVLIFGFGKVQVKQKAERKGGIQLRVEV